jgi:hypothetical protein
MGEVADLGGIDSLICRMERDWLSWSPTPRMGEACHVSLVIIFPAIRFAGSICHCGIAGRVLSCCNLISTRTAHSAMSEWNPLCTALYWCGV